VNVDIAALRAIERDKDIPFDTVIEAIETALLTAYKHTDGHQPHAKIDIDRRTGIVRVIAYELGTDGEQLEELAVRTTGSRRLVTVVVDADDGIDLDAVAEVSRAVSAALDAHDPNGMVLGGSYTLEVDPGGVNLTINATAEAPRVVRSETDTWVVMGLEGATLV